MATYFRLTDFSRQFLDSNGDPLNGGKLHTYEGGTTTAKTTYSDNAGISAHANPIILDSAGRIPDEIWGTTGAYDFKLTDSADVTIDTPGNIVGFNDTAAAAVDEWVASGLTPTYVDADTFTLVGDQTTVFHAGRRVKITDAGTDYGTILSSSYSDPNTTVNVILDSGSIDSGISAVSYGHVSVANSSANLGAIVITRGTVSAAASLDLLNLTTAYCKYEIVFNNLIPAGNAINLLMRVSTDNSTFISTSSYGHARVGHSSGTGSSSSSDTSMIIAGAVGNAANEDVAGTITILNPGHASPTQATWNVSYVNSSAAYTGASGSGIYLADTAVQGVQLLMSDAGNMSLQYTLIGYKA